LVRQTANYAIMYARSDSPFGQNMLFCSQRYHSSFDNFLFNPIDIFNNYVNSAVGKNQLRVCSFTSEMIEVRDRIEIFLNSFLLFNAELKDIITHVCTC
jgi:hypothetical protein